MTQTKTDCPDCGGSGLTLTMDVCHHGESAAPSVYDYDVPVHPDDLAAAGMARFTATAKVRLATPAQVDFIRTLIAEREPTHHAVMGALAAIASPVTAKWASEIITVLKAVPATKSVRVNRFAGTCRDCETPVDAEKGRIEKSAGGKWITYHLAGECPDGTAKADLLADQVTEPGVYSHDGAFYRVKPGRYDKTTLWSERIDVVDGEMTFVRSGRPTFLRASEKITLAEARAFGVGVGSCVFCGLTLYGEDGRSLVAGYGPTCAANHGLPYPNTAEMVAITAGTATWDELLAARSA